MLVELQLNNDLFFVGDRMSRGLTDAITQMKNWFGWLVQNEPSDVSRTEGTIVVGRKENYVKNKARVDNAIASLGLNVKLLTYDDLRDGMLQIISEIQEAINEHKKRKAAKA
jgi:hypothetical protein